MAARGRSLESAGDLVPLECELMRYCLSQKEDMVFLIDLTTALARLPKSLQGAWYDPALLTPKQKAAHAEVVKEVNKALRRLFKAGFIDVGAEETFSEGFKRRHRDVISALQRDPRWESGEQTDLLQAEIRAKTVWAEATDLRAVLKQMGEPVEMVGLTPEGRVFAERELQDAPEGTVAT